MGRVPQAAEGLTRRDFLKVGGGAFAAASILGLAGCGSSESQGGQVSLEFANWVSAEEATRANMNKVLKAYQNQNETNIKNTAIPFDQMEQQLLNRAAGGNPPDVMQLSGPWSQELGANGALVDLREMVGEDFLNKNYQGGLAAGEYQDKLYAAPLSLTPHAFWYNKELMEQAVLDPESPPKTMDELNQQMAQIKSELGSQGVYPIGLDTTKISYALVQFWPWFFTFDARPLYNDEINFNTPEVGNALQWLRDAANKGYTPTGQQIKEERELMARDKIVFKLDGPYFVGILRSLNSDLEGDAFYDKFAVTTVPVGANEKSETLADIHQIGISSQAADQDAAWNFAKYLIQSKESIQQYQIPYGVLPALKPDLKGNEAFSDPVSQTYIDEIFPTMVGGPYGPNFGEAQNFIIQAMQTAALENTPIKEILKQTQQNLETVYGS